MQLVNGNKTFILSLLVLDIWTCSQQFKRNAYLLMIYRTCFNDVGLCLKLNIYGRFLYERGLYRENTRLTRTMSFLTIYCLIFLTFTACFEMQKSRLLLSSQFQC